MTIQVTCECGATYALKPKFAGKRVKCAKCKNAFQVPIPPVAAREDNGLGPALVVEANLLASPNPLSKSAAEAGSRQDDEPASSDRGKKRKLNQYGIAAIVSMLIAAAVPLVPSMIYAAYIAYNYFDAKALLADCTIVDVPVHLVKMTRTKSTSSDADGHAETTYSTSYRCEYTYVVNGKNLKKQFTTTDFNRGNTVITIAYSNTDPANSGRLMDLQSSANLTLNLIFSGCLCVGSLASAALFSGIVGFAFYQHGKQRRLER